MRHAPDRLRFCVTTVSLICDTRTMSLVSERDLVASPSGRPLRELLLCAVRVYAGGPARGLTSAGLTRRSIACRCVLAMSNDAAAERGSQAQHSEMSLLTRTVCLFVACFHLPQTLPQLR